MAESLKKKAFQGVKWTTADLVVNLGFNFIIGIILARLLSPGDYGMLAMIAIFNAIAKSFLDCGFGSALIRKACLTDDDTSTAFYFNICAGAILCGILWLISPFVAIFYHTPELSSLLRAQSLALFLSGFYVIQTTLFKRALKFKLLAYVGTACNVVSGLIGIGTAYYGWGVWSLIAMNLSDRIMRMILLWWFSTWRPRGKWSQESFRYLWGFGSKLLASGLIDTIYKNIYPIIIGRFFSAASLGQYTRATHYTQLSSKTITSVLQQVTYPVLSQIQNDDSRLRDAYRRMLRVSGFVVFPATMGMAALARPLVISLITEKWSECIPYLQILCFAAMLYPIHAINLNLLKVKGRSDLFLGLEIIKKIIITLVIFISIPFGVIGMCVGSVFTSYASLAINTYYTGKMINMGLWRQLWDLTPTIINSFVMALIVHYSIHFIDNCYIQLLVGLAIGISYYLTSSYLLHFSELKEFVSLIKRK